MENSEKLFQLILDYIHSWEYIIGPDAKLKYVSPSCEKYTGYPMQSFLDDEKLLLKIIHPDDKEFFIRHLRYEGCDPCIHNMEFRIIDTSKRTRWFSHSCQPIFDDNKQFLGRRASNHEITDFKEEVQRSEKIARQLSETTTLLNTVLDAIPDVIGVQDGNHNIICYNKAGYKFLGMDHSGVYNKKCYELIGRRSPCEICATSEVYKTKRTAQREKFIPELNSWLDVRAYPILDDDGNIVKVIEHLRDISREKEAEEQLKKAHERLITILDSVEAHIYAVDLETNKILFMNRKMKVDYNVDFTDKICHESFHNLSNSCEHCTKEKLLDENGRPRESVTLESFNPVTKRWYMNYARVIQWVDGRMVKLQIATDITISKNNEEFRYQMQKQLQQAQKFEAIGTLAGGIAHDFNNLLTGILGQASLMTYELAPDHPCKKRVDDIVTCTKSATDLTNQLLGFSRGGKYEVKAININDVLVESSSMFGRAKKELDIHTKLAHPPPIVDADRRQIEQVLLNLYINAWQAMPEEGGIYLETKVVEAHETKTQVFLSNQGLFVRISVTDTGIGMSQEVMEQIFDPFYTTKEKGRGTGLGLASAYGIVKNHNGLIDVTSTVGEGSTFNIYLPLSEEQPDVQPSMRESLNGGPESILLVDDEDLVRDVGKDMLESLGYHVVTADKGEDAVNLIKNNTVKFDLVILDIVMPGMDGGKTYDAILDLVPLVPVILASGYSINGKAEDIMKKGGRAFIQKPFDLNTLSTTVRNVLDEYC